MRTFLQERASPRIRSKTCPACASLWWARPPRRHSSGLASIAPPSTLPWFGLSSSPRRPPSSASARPTSTRYAHAPMPNSQCQTPNAQCQMPNAHCPMPTDQVRMFLAGGVALTDVAMLDKDDTVYFAWRGEAWREPGSEPGSEAPAAKEPAAVAAEEASAAKASAQEAASREASPVEPASSRPQPSAEEHLVRRSRDAHRQRDAFRAGQRVHAAQRVHTPASARTSSFAAAQQHAAPRTPHSRLRGREGAEGREGTRHSLPSRGSITPSRGSIRARLAASVRDARAAAPGQLGACGSPSTSWLRAVSDAHGLQCTWVWTRASNEG